MENTDPNKICYAKCNATCCRYAMMPLSGEDHAKWALYHGFKVYRIKQTGDYRALFPSKCSKLTEDGKCSVYGTKDRPDMCNDFWCGGVTYEEYGG
jgi:hypothetical protein